eukprot:1160445-Pelagomonas_calceolata.AAC.9
MILVTPCPANPNRPPTPSSHQVLRSMRRNEVVRSSTTPARQLHELNIQNRHIHLIEIKYCEDTRPGALLEASQQQHSELPQCANNFKELISLSTQSSWVWVGLSILPMPWINWKTLGIDPQSSTKLA